MRVCPVCNESFVDEFRFCELDGARLERQREESASASNKGWSFVGIGLLVGAIILSVSIFFLPKRPPTRVASAPISNPAPAEVAPGTAAVGVEAYQPPAAVPATATDEAAALEARKKKAQTDSDSNDPPLNPKAAFKTEESSEAPAAVASEPALAKKAETPSNGKLGGETRADATTKPEKTAAESRKEPKQPAASGSKEPDKQSDKKKTGDDKEKKKGGFFRVFKKIFGKD